jgi:hypothetical protein
MRRLAICLTAFLLTGAVLVAQDLSSAAQQSSSISQDSTTAASGQEPAAGDSAEASETKGDHKHHLRLGTITVGAGYFSGPFLYPYGPYGWYPYYSAAFWDPFLGPYGSFGYLPSLAYGNEKGEVKLAADPKRAGVYIDGAYAGTADRLKTIWLEPGAYDLSLYYTGRESFHQRIYVLTGKSLKIAAKLAPQNAAAGTREEKQ